MIFAPFLLLFLLLCYVCLSVVLPPLTVFVQLSQLGGQFFGPSRLILGFGSISCRKKGLNIKDPFFFAFIFNFLDLFLKF